MERTHDKVWMSWITFGSTSCTRGGAGRTKVNRLHPKLHPNAAPIIFHRNFRVFSHIGYSFLRCIDALNIRFFIFWMKLKKKQFQIFYKWFSSLTLPLSSNPKKNYSNMKNLCVQDIIWIPRWTEMIFMKCIWGRKCEIESMWKMCVWDIRCIPRRV